MEDMPKCGVAVMCEAQKEQVGGDHYKDMAIQPITFIMANNLPFAEGNVVKYAARHRNKNGAEDIKKAIQYCQFILEREYNIKSEVKYNNESKD